MAVRLVRAGRHGEEEQVALQNSTAVIGWNWLPHLARVADREGVAAPSAVTWVRTRMGKSSRA